MKVTESPLRGDGTKNRQKSNFNTGISAGNKKKFFRSSVAVRLSISTKLCMRIEDVSTIFATDNYFWIQFLYQPTLVG